jgi:hypothetical protein
VARTRSDGDTGGAPSGAVGDRSVAGGTRRAAPFVAGAFVFATVRLAIAFRPVVFFAAAFFGLAVTFFGFGFAFAFTFAERDCFFAAGFFDVPRPAMDPR